MAWSGEKDGVRLPIWWRLVAAMFSGGMLWVELPKLDRLTQHGTVMPEVWRLIDIAPHIGVALLILIVAVTPVLSWRAGVIAVMAAFFGLFAFFFIGMGGYMLAYPTDPGPGGLAVSWTSPILLERVAYVLELIFFWPGPPIVMIGVGVWIVWSALSIFFESEEEEEKE